jgi:hypothetical protein
MDLYYCFICYYSDDLARGTGQERAKHRFMANIYIQSKVVRRSIWLALSLFLLVVSHGPALAIPSPELVVGSLTSLSQLAAIGSALLGGGAALKAAENKPALAA